MALFHEEERHTIWIINDWERRHPGARYSASFEEGDSYLCTFFTEFEGVNEFEDDDPLFEEFLTIWMNVVKVIKRGPNVNDLGGPNGLQKDAILQLNYKYFPSLITTDNGVQLYPPSDAI
jgi:hypothetical protein